MTYYTVQDFTQIYADRADAEFDLQESTLKVIHYLLQNIVIPPPESEDLQNNMTKPQERLFSNRRNGGAKRFRKDNQAEWENARSSVPFKPTKLEDKEGLEKQISDVRGLLNKISTKNYETQKDAIIVKLSLILESESASDKVANIIFDIASTNKFYSELYALLYCELVHKFSIFKDVLSGFVERYMNSLHKIHYVDHNVDYDGFCNYTKTNDLRKAAATFIINLMKRGLIQSDVVHKIILDIQNLVRKYIKEDNRTNEVDEIVENMFIFITQSKESLAKYPDWGSGIMAFVKSIAGMKSKDQKSLSSRAIFKCMDIGEP